MEGEVLTGFFFLNLLAGGGGGGFPPSSMRVGILQERCIAFRSCVKLSKPDPY